MSEKVKINGKEYSINVTWGKFERSIDRRQKKTKWSNPKHLIYDIWDYLDRGLIFKPFVFRSRLKNKLSLPEMLEIDKKIGEMVSMEGRQSGNSV